MPKLCEVGGGEMNCRTPNIPMKDCMLPWEGRLGIRASRYMHYELKRVKMGAFRALDCGMRSVAITYTPTGRNYLPPVLVHGHSWVDMEENAKYYFVPNSGNPTNQDSSCGEGGFCDSLYQTFLSVVYSSRGP